MGGHALKKVKASRIDINTYNEIKLDLSKKFSSTLCMEFLIDMPNKTDFGDIDILYLANSQIDIIQLIKQTYNPIEIVLNGDVCSFAYQIILNNETKYFQVDLIKCENLEMSRFYFSYGDLGGILGRIAQHIGLKFGSKGLWVCLKSETIYNFLDLDENIDFKKNLIKELESNNVEISSITNAQHNDIILTTKPEDICKYLDLDLVVWTNGFNSKDKIFKWICKSKYFNIDIFRAMNYEHRNRISKRQMYQDFIQYILGFDNETEYKFIIEKGNSINCYNINLQLETLEYFNKFELLKKSINLVCTDLIRKKKFNGKKFLDLGIIDRQIAICMKEFKKKIEFENELLFQNWIDNNDYETIDLSIHNFVSKYEK